MVQVASAQTYAEPMACTGPGLGSVVHGEADRDGLIAPHCIDMEGIVLSHALEHGPIAGLQPKHFYADRHKRIYEAIVATGGDVVLVAAELRRDGRIKQVGGTPYLAMLIERQPVTAYPERLAELLRELYRRRTLSDVALELRVKLRTGEIGAAEAWRWFKQRCEEVAEE